MTRTPILSRALIVSGLGLAYAILAHFGVTLPAEIKDNAEAFAVVLAPLVVAYWAKRHTTPTADPRDGDGNALVPVPMTETDPGEFAAYADGEPVDETATTVIPVIERP